MWPICRGPTLISILLALVCVLIGCSAQSDSPPTVKDAEVEQEGGFLLEEDKRPTGFGSNLYLFGPPQGASPPPPTIATPQEEALQPTYDLSVEHV